MKKILTTMAITAILTAGTITAAFAIPIMSNDMTDTKDFHHPAFLQASIFNNEESPVGATKMIYNLRSGRTVYKRGL